MDSVVYWLIVSQNMLCLGLQKDSDDARAFSFLKILGLIPHTSQPPSVLFVENVVGFEVVHNISAQGLNFNFFATLQISVPSC